MYRRTFSILVLTIFLLILCSCSSLFPGTSFQDVTFSEYSDRFGDTEDTLPSNMSTFGIFVSQDPTQDMEGKTLIIEDPSKPIYITCNYKGPISTTITLTIYYDYLQIPFFVGTSFEGTYSYAFQLENQKEVKLPIILDNISPDESHHKLLFSLTSDSDKHITNKEEISNNSVFTHVCELFYSTTASQDMKLPDEKTIPDLCFHGDNPAALIINTDLENQHITSHNLPALPPPQYQIESGSPLNLMYNITGIENSSSALLFLTLNYMQTPINNENFLVFDIKNDETINGKLNILSPQEPGLYEVIGYVIFNPTVSVETTMIPLIETSFRFTLHVI